MQVIYITKASTGKLVSIYSYHDVKKIILTGDEDSYRLDVCFNKMTYDDRRSTYQEHYLLQITSEQAKQVEEALLNGQDIILQTIKDE